MGVGHETWGDVPKADPALASPTPPQQPAGPGWPGGSTPRGSSYQ